ncbi:hypothetical protein C8Q79DRAFT_483990 [Trametes meyenii]|nr:hypothetical protein C8Q79DRAFT_483990 [Trametes meyenii]
MLRMTSLSVPYGTTFGSMHMLWTAFILAKCDCCWNCRMFALAEIILAPVHSRQVPSSSALESVFENRQGKHRTTPSAESIPRVMSVGGRGSGRSGDVLERDCHRVGQLGERFPRLFVSNFSETIFKKGWLPSESMR